MKGLVVGGANASLNIQTCGNLAVDHEQYPGRLTNYTDLTGSIGYLRVPPMVFISAKGPKFTHEFE
jgi:hypothetical protein